jgi:hypothetical protein
VKCNCRQCKRHRKWNRALKGLTKKQRETVDEIITTLLSVELDSDVEAAKQDGSWYIPDNLINTEDII